jgi:uncharacterized protein (TIGR03067 family)
MSDGQDPNSTEHIFSIAAEIRSSAERVAYLHEACAGDETLRAQVEALLHHDADAGSFLDKRPDELLAADATQPVDGGDQPDDSWRELLEPIDLPDRIGRLGQYEVIELVGRGGMGVVLRAFDPKLNRIVAVKLLAPELAANALSVQRFMREARAAAAVSHDHVVAIYAIDDDARPPLIVMEYIDGQSLQQKIDSTGALDVKSILRVGMQAAAGLSAAHRQGLVHRDIKPANILLENGIEKVKLTDFGLARAVDDISMTRTGQITGTPQYMSPEQAQGQRVDHRTDLFSLGCVLYAMCTGRAAFRADSAVAVMHRIVHDTPRPVREVNEEIPDRLCDIIDKLLAKNPEDRFESAEEVAELLGQHLAHLQQPDSVPMPDPVGTGRDSQGRPAAWTISEAIRSTANLFVGIVVFAVVVLVVFVGTGATTAVFFGPIGDVQKLLLSGLLVAVSLGTGWLVVRMMNRRSKGQVLLQASHNEAQTSASDAANDNQPTRSFVRRVPIPTWIALLLFGMVFVAAIVEMAGGHDASSRGNGVLFYLLGTGFVLVWGACSLASQIIRGSRPADASLPPTRGHIAAFFTAVILLQGVFIWHWAELSNKPDRDQLAGFFLGHGTITMTLDDPGIAVEFNGQPVEIAADGRVVLRAEWPGSFVVEIHRRNGTIGYSEFLIHSGMSARLGSGLFDGATRVSVTGPIRGAVPAESGKEIDTPEWLDLLTNINLDLHATDREIRTNTRWTRDERGFTLATNDESLWSSLVPPLEVLSDYELEVNFIVSNGQDDWHGGWPSITFPVLNASCDLFLDHQTGVSGLHVVNRRTTSVTDRTDFAVFVGSPVKTDVEHTLLLSVRKRDEYEVIIDSTIDGQRLIHWEGAAASLSSYTKLQLPRKGLIGLGAHVSALDDARCSVTYTSARIRQIAGGGENDGSINPIDPKLPRLPRPSKEPGPLDGVWRLVSFDAQPGIKTWLETMFKDDAGHFVAKHQIEFRRGRMVATLGETTHDGRFGINSNASPAQLDMINDDGTLNQKCIYHLDADTLVIALPMFFSERPASFEIAVKIYVLTFRRVTDAEQLTNGDSEVTVTEPDPNALIDSKLLLDDFRLFYLEQSPANRSAIEKVTDPFAAAAGIAMMRIHSPGFLRLPRGTEAALARGEFDDVAAKERIEPRLRQTKELAVELPAMTRAIVADYEADALSGIRLVLAEHLIAAAHDRIRKESE